MSSGGFSVPMVMHRLGAGRAGCMVARLHDSIDPRGRLTVSEEEEVIEEEPAEDRDAEQVKRRPPRRRYRRTSKLLLETDTARLEGTVASATLSDGNGAPTNANKNAEAPVRYALLRMNAARTEVQLVPVTEWFNFRKPAVAAPKQLEEIDEDFEVRKSLLKEKRERYKRIAQALKVSETGAAAEEEMLPSDCFGTAAKRNKRTKGDALRFKVESLLEDSYAGLAEVLCISSLSLSLTTPRTAPTPATAHLRATRTSSS